VLKLEIIMSDTLILISYNMSDMAWPTPTGTKLKTIKIQNRHLVRPTDGCGIVFSFFVLFAKYRTMRCAVHVARMGENRYAYRILVGKPNGKGPLGRPRRKWVDNTKCILERYNGVVRTGSIWLRIGKSGELL
jgi:hypothetical protein